MIFCNPEMVTNICQTNEELTLTTNAGVLHTNMKANVPGWGEVQFNPAAMTNIMEENLLQMVLWKMVHFALFLVKISINFSPGYSTVFFPSQCTSLLYKNFKILLQKFQNFCTMC
jgi:hypothetical protein